MHTVEPSELRARFARALSEMYGREVPAYTTLVEVAHEVNASVARADGAAAERLGSLERVTAERHGAIRLGTPRELRQAASIFGAMGMRPVGFYDLRDAAPIPVPVVSTAFRPIDPAELARNPFRVFTSLLATGDERFFDSDLRHRLEAFLNQRVLFDRELLQLAARAEAGGGLDTSGADRFVVLAVEAFALSREPVDEQWYRELERISPVAADIGGIASTHVNHLTPRVLDIDELYVRMQARGVQMIDAIQGPPRRKVPILLRQTSFRALSEQRRLRFSDGSVGEGALRVRFGEVEARGIALTADGREFHESQQWAALPDDEHALAAADLACFTFEPISGRKADGTVPPRNVAGLLHGGWITAEPIVYEDFLPRSAAGIFQSNLDADPGRGAQTAGAALNAQWLSGVLDRELADPIALATAQRDASLDAVRTALHLRPTRS